MNILNRKNRKESASIMLEVVAVLALMGVMGSMLFRQIYQRNQELHNIQMASEIRTVKEAFSAYIQANRPIILEECKVLNANGSCQKASNSIANGVVEYLPEGWFDGGDLDAAYRFTLWTYIQQDVSARQIVYGVVAPKDDTLPSTGWNFKRAARVALLIGADGGVYGPGITTCSNPDYGTTCIAGALGAWELPSSGIIDSDEDTPTYAAMTALDIFTPESLAPDVNVNLPRDWDVALKELHAFNYFSVGGDSNCYTIQHNVATEGEIKQDTINKAACSPLFWVGKADKGQDEKAGNVYVATDLNLGRISGSGHDKTLQLTAEGVIKQKDGLTIDREGRIIAKETVSADIGDLKVGENYVLDPAYTSTMNDIRLASRGGVRLSEILPNYILKSVYYGECDIKKGSDNDTTLTNTEGKKTTTWCDLMLREMKTFGIDGNARGNMATSNADTKTTVTIDACPSGYKNAIIVIPIRFGYLPSKVTKMSHKHYAINQQTDNGDSVSIVTNSAWNDTNNDGTFLDGEPLDVKFVSDVPNCQLFFTISKKSGAGSAYNTDKGGWYHDDSGSNIRITMGYHNGGLLYVGGAAYTNCPIPDSVANGVVERVQAMVQTYCVWTPSLLSSQEKCEAAGYVWSASKCTATRRNAAAGDGANVKSIERNQAACIAAGLTWENNRCVTKYANTNSAAACKAAGKTWTWSNDARTEGSCS